MDRKQRFRAFVLPALATLFMIGNYRRAKRNGEYQSDPYSIADRHWYGFGYIAQQGNRVFEN